MGFCCALSGTVQYQIWNTTIGFLTIFIYKLWVYAVATFRYFSTSNLKQRRLAIDVLSPHIFKVVREWGKGGERVVRGWWEGGERDILSIQLLDLFHPPLLLIVSSPTFYSGPCCSMTCLFRKCIAKQQAIAAAKPNTKAPNQERLIRNPFQEKQLLINCESKIFLTKSVFFHL